MGAHFPVSLNASIRSDGSWGETCGFRVGLRIIYEDSAMNKDQVKGAAKDVGGKVQQKVGEAVGSVEQQAKGLKNQAEGKAQKAAGNIKEAVRDNRKH